MLDYAVDLPYLNKLASSLEERKVFCQRHICAADGADDEIHYRTKVSSLTHADEAS
jgi:hypothetical protein